VVRFDNYIHKISLKKKKLKTLMLTLIQKCGPIP